MGNVSKKKPTYFSILESAVRYDDRLTDFAKILYSDIAVLCKKTGCCTASNRYFGTLYGRSIRTICRSISSLAKLGYISVAVERDERNVVVCRRIRLLNGGQSADEKNYDEANSSALDARSAPNRGIDASQNWVRSATDAYPSRKEAYLDEVEGCPDPGAKEICTPTVTIGLKIRKEKNNIYTPKGGVYALFSQFWDAYPRKVGKAAAKDEFMALLPDEQTVQAMLHALDWQKDQLNWTRANVQYIPYPERWLRERRWEDEPDPGPAKRPEVGINGLPYEEW